MSRFRNLTYLLAVAGVLSVVAWGCSTDSPTAPRQQVPPVTPPSGQTYTITITADPGGISLPDAGATGAESTTLVVTVSSPTPADGTTIQVTTDLGSFSAVGGVTTVGPPLTNGRAFLTLFAGALPVQTGVATVQASLASSNGSLQVPISNLTANFSCSNPEANDSVTFTNTSTPGIESSLWDFGDGKTSTEFSPHHVYSSPGIKSVRLTVTKTILGAELQATVVQQIDTTLTTCLVGTAPPVP